jgi:hypothetical protein
MEKLSQWMEPTWVITSLTGKEIGRGHWLFHPPPPLSLSLFILGVLGIVSIWCPSLGTLEASVRTSVVGE